MFSFKKKSIEIKAPVKGKIVNIEAVSDPVFSQKMMGDGVAIQYAGGDVYAPVSGVISALILPSMHAFGIRTDDGADILVHVGLETVNLKGEGFSLIRAQGDRVEAGDKILAIDYDLLKSKAMDLITPIILTNPDAFSLEPQAGVGSEALAGSTTIFTIKKK